MEKETALTTAEKNALSVSYDVLGTHVELDMDMVKRYLVRGRAEFVTDQEVVMFMHTCRANSLNPMVQGDVHLIKYSKDEPAQMVIGKDAYLRRAYDNPDYIYKEDGIVVQRGNEILKKEGTCLYPGESLLGGWCRVHYNRAGAERIAYKEVALSEYNKGMANWKSKPATMISKVAVSQCVREAFPKEYRGVYSEEELVASGVLSASGNVIDLPEGSYSDKADSGTDSDTGPQIDPDDEIVTKEQRRALFSMARSAFGDDANDALKMILANHGIDSTEGITVGVYKAICSDIVDMAEEHGKDPEPPDPDDQ